jgi:uncharacterized protein (TIGR01777 family)
MKLLLTGGTGFIGRHLVRRLLIEGHQLSLLTRDPVAASRGLPRPVALFGWDASAGPTPEALEELDGVIHLAGEPLGERRWSAAQKRRIVESRVVSTERLMEALRAVAGAKPGVVIASSAIGYYGDRGDKVLGEEAVPGTDFLATLCRDWEAALQAGAPEGTRTLSLRTGLVLGRDGGALPRLVPLFRAGLGGRLASGRQWMSWIHIDDLVSLIVHALGTQDLRGAVNAVAPEPARNRDFTRELARALRRPALFPVPGFALRIALGEMAGVLTGGQRVRPARAQASGFTFRYSALRAALEDLCADAAAGLSRFEAEQWLPAPPEELFPFFLEPRNLESLMPPWLRFRIRGLSTETVGPGTLIDCALRVRGVPVRGRARIEELEPPRRFMEVQLKGPFARWRHAHRFAPAAGGTLMRDIVRYRLPLGAVGSLVAGRLVRRGLRRLFAYRRGQLAARFGGGTGPPVEARIAFPSGSR